MAGAARCRPYRTSSDVVLSHIIRNFVGATLARPPIILLQSSLRDIYRHLKLDAFALYLFVGAHPCVRPPDVGILPPVYYSRSANNTPAAIKTEPTSNPGVNG